MPLIHFLEYLQLERKYSPHTLIAYRRDLVSFRDFIQQEFDDHPLEQVSYPMVRSWIVSLVDAGNSNLSINRKVSALRSFYKFLLKTKQIEVSPLAKHQSLKVVKKVQIPFSEAEMRSALDREAETFEEKRN